MNKHAIDAQVEERVTNFVAVQERGVGNMAQQHGYKYLQEEERLVCVVPPWEDVGVALLGGSGDPSRGLDLAGCAVVLLLYGEKVVLGGQGWGIVVPCSEHIGLAAIHTTNSTRGRSKEGSFTAFVSCCETVAHL